MRGVEILRSIFERAYNKAKRYGDIEYYGVWDKSIEIIIGNNMITNVRVSEGGGYSIRLSVDGRIAVQGSEDLRVERVDEIINRLYKIASSVEKDPNWKRFSKGYSRVELGTVYDKSFEKPIEEHVRLAKEIIDRCNDEAIRGGASRSIVARGYVRLHIKDVFIANSYGDEISGRSTFFNMWIVIKSWSPRGESSFETMYATRRLDENAILDEAGYAGRLSPSFIGAKQVPSGTYDVIFTPLASSLILDTVLSPAFSALNVQEKRSPLRGKLGEKILSDDVTIYDDPHMPWAPGSSEFDDEGLRTTKKPLFEKGVLRNYVYDTYTALREGRESTGNAVRRSLTAPPVPMVYNLKIEPGKVNPDQMIREVKRGIIVYFMIGYWMSNPVNGNVSATISHGYYIENGEIKHPVKGIVISGNIYEMLGKKLEALGNDPKIYYGVYSPSIFVKGISVAGL